MDIQTLADNHDGKLINIKRKWSYYIASPKQGIIKFNLDGEITEMGVDHNTTLRMVQPLHIELESNDSLQILKQKTKKIRLKCGSLVIYKKLKTSIGKLKCAITLDVNDDCEVVTSVIVRPCKKYFCSDIKEVLTVTFKVYGDFVEHLNCKEKLFVALLNDEDDVMAINAIQNVTDIKVLSEENSLSCNITTDRIISKKNFLPAIFKFAVKRLD